MRYLLKSNIKKNKVHNCQQLKLWIINKFFYYLSEYYITPSISITPYTYSYMKLKKQFNMFHYTKLK